MKFLKNILLLVILSSLTILMNCSEDTDNFVNPFNTQVALVSGAWGTTNDDVYLDDEVAAPLFGDWSGFTVTFSSSGNFTTNGVPDNFDSVWPSSGTWSLSQISKMTRGGGSETREIDIVVTETTLKLTFKNSSDNNRVSAIQGLWEFNMKKL